jgi:hypothetical protein
MVYLKQSDYTGQKVKNNRYSPKTKLPIQAKSNHKSNPYMILCPTGCTQSRTKSYRLSSKKTFDTRTNRCSNCNFYKSDEKVIHPVIYKNGNGRIIP